MPTDDRVSAALAAAMAEEDTPAGVLAALRRSGFEIVEAVTRRPGRPASISAELRARIRAMAETEGLGPSAIAAALNTEGVPTGAGGAKWYPSTIRWVLSD